MKSKLYYTTFVVAAIASYFQSEMEESLPGKFLLFAINLSGVFLFIIASDMPETERFKKRFKNAPSWIILSGAIIVRIYTFIYIPMVYEASSMWHLITVNIILLFCEIGIFFYGDPEQTKQIANRWQRYAENKERETIVLKQKLETVKQAKPETMKRTKKRNTETDTETLKRFIIANHETMSQREIAKQTGVSPSKINRLKKQLNGQLK